MSAFATRQRFHVELKNNYYVSWKKLLKTAAGPSEGPPPGAKPGLEARIAPEAVAGAAVPSQGRMASVIEKIEHMYKGVDTDDEGEDEGYQYDSEHYDTDDSFIDDDDLDDYFEVDKVKTKHTGFFINKGRIENLDEEPVVNSLKKKKHAGGSSAPMKRRLKTSARKSATDEPEGSESLKVAKTGHQSSPGMEKARDEGGKLSASPKVFVPEKGTVADPTKLKKAQLDTTKSSKTSLVTSKEGSPTKRGSAVLEKAIQELERGVAECVTSWSHQDTVQSFEDPNSHCTKAKRLPREVKIKLAKVARLSGGEQGKVSDELIARLMKSMGRFMQVKTLKKNIKEMIEHGLNAKKEKQERLEGIKKEIVEMVKARIASGQGLRGITDEQPEAGMPSREFVWDCATEDKICELYELYLEGMDEHKGAPSRKFYTEIAELWPEGCMDNNGVRCAVLRAKDRRRGAMKQAKSEEKKRRRLLEASSKLAEPGGVAAATGAKFHPLPTKESKQVENLNGSCRKSQAASAAVLNNAQGKVEEGSGTSIIANRQCEASAEAIMSSSLRRIKKEMSNKPAASKECYATSLLAWQQQQQQQQQFSFRKDERAALLPEPC